MTDKEQNQMGQKKQDSAPQDFETLITLIFLSFRTDRSGQTVQTQIRLGAV